MSGFLSILGPKRVELLHELLPAANTIALLANPGNDIIPVLLLAQADEVIE
jgi:hypothetical protein